MMWWFGFALAGLPLCGTQGAELAPIALYTQFAEQPPVAVSDAMQREVSRSWRPWACDFTGWSWLNRTESKFQSNWQSSRLAAAATWAD